MVDYAFNYYPNFLARLLCQVILALGVNMKVDVKIVITTIIFVVIVCYLSYCVYFLNQVFIHAENGWLENIQVVTLLIACVTFIFPVFSQKREDKLMLIFFSFLCFSFVLREVDVEEFDVPSIVILLGHGIGRNIMLTVGFVAMSVYAALNYQYYKKLAKNFLYPQVG